MRYSNSFFQYVAVCFALIAGSPAILMPSFAAAEVVNALPKDTLRGYMQLSLKDNTKLLAPARAAFEKGDIDECRRLLERAAAESGIMPHPEVQLATWFLSAGKTGAAQQILEKVSLDEPNRPDLRWLYCQVALSQGRLFDAWTHVLLAERTPTPSRWTKEYADHMKGLIAKSKAAIADQRGDWAVSEKLHKELLVMGVRTATVDRALGRAAFFQDRPDEAYKYFVRASQSNELDALPQLLMAAMYEQKGNAEKTEEWFKKGDAAGNQDAERIRLEYIRWLIRQNRSADARRVATKFRPSDENRRDFEYAIALCGRMDGDFAVAEKILSRLNLASPKSFAISNQLALVLVESGDQGKLGRAMQLAQTNARNFPNSSDAITTYGWVQQRLGDSVGANQTFGVLLRSKQASRDAAYYIAQVNYSLGQKEAGDAFIQAAKNSEGEFFNAFRVDEKL
tara:strand:+ start:106714 stop:108072 length:1359 start_codon:yes stop_codon:yes gene_type:complete